MNLSQVAVELEAKQPDREPLLRSEEARLVRIIEAIQGIRATKEWSTLKNEIFDSRVNILEKDLKSEAKKEDADPKKLNRISGELKWAERYSDLEKLENVYKVDLSNIRQQLHGKTQE